MEKLITLRVDHLRLNDLGGLVTDTISRVTPDVEALGDVAAAKLATLKATNDRFHDVLNKQYTSELTPKIQEYDALRDDLFTEIKRTAKASAESSLSAIAASGKRVLVFLEPFWNLTKKPMMSQTDEIEVFKKRYTADPTLASDVANLGLGMQMQRLFATNTSLFTLYDERARLLVGVEGTPSATSLKNEVARDYDEFCVALETVYSALPTPTLHALFTELNDIRRKYISKIPTPLNKDYTSVAPIPAEVHNGKHRTPLPRVFVTLDGELIELVFAVDFDVTYHNNVNVGTAHLYIHGKGKYTGTFVTTFQIVNAS